MSGDSYYFGESVTMHGGQNNTGIDKRQAAPADVAAVPPSCRQLFRKCSNWSRSCAIKFPGQARRCSMNPFQASVLTEVCSRKNDTAP